MDRNSRRFRSDCNSSYQQGSRLEREINYLYFIIFKSYIEGNKKVILSQDKELGHASANDIIAECDLKKRRYPGIFYLSFFTLNYLTLSIKNEVT